MCACVRKRGREGQRESAHAWRRSRRVDGTDTCAPSRAAARCCHPQPPPARGAAAPSSLCCQSFCQSFASTLSRPHSPERLSHFPHTKSEFLKCLVFAKYHVIAMRMNRCVRCAGRVVRPIAGSERHKLGAAFPTTSSLFPYDCVWCITVRQMYP